MRQLRGVHPAGAQYKTLQVPGCAIVERIPEAIIEMLSMSEVLRETMAVMAQRRQILRSAAPQRRAHLWITVKVNS